MCKLLSPVLLNVRRADWPLLLLSLLTFAGGLYLAIRVDASRFHLIPRFLPLAFILFSQLLGITTVGALLSLLFGLYLLPEAHTALYLLATASILTAANYRLLRDRIFIYLAHSCGAFLLGLSHSPSWIHWLDKPALWW